MGNIILFDSQGRVYVDCFGCGEGRGSTVNTLCGKCLQKYYRNELNFKCPAIRKMHEANRRKVNK